jgi:hypothetical protein
MAEASGRYFQTVDSQNQEVFGKRWVDLSPWTWPEFLEPGLFQPFSKEVLT